MTTSGEQPNIGSFVVARLVAVGNPAAGADWSYAVTQAGQLLTVRALLVTSAAVANRFPVLIIADGAGHEVWRAANSISQPATITRQHVAGQGVQENFGGNVSGLNLPAGLVVGVGWTISTTTISLDVGDQWSGIVMAFPG